MVVVVVVLVSESYEFPVYSPLAWMTCAAFGDCSG